MGDEGETLEFLQEKGDIFIKLSTVERKRQADLGIYYISSIIFLNSSDLMYIQFIYTIFRGCNCTHSIRNRSVQNHGQRSCGRSNE